LRSPRSGRLEGCRPQTGLMVRDALRAPHHEELPEVRRNRMKRRDFLAGSAACSLAALTGQALAQSGPLTKVVFPFAAGGGGDALCRLLAQHIGPLLDRSVIVENRTGGDGLIGIKAVKGANRDGTTILVTTGPTMYLLPMVETTPSFDATKDFAPVSQLAKFEFCVFVGTAVPAEV